MKSLAIIALILAAGCVTTSDVNSGLVLSLQPDPTTVLAGERVRLNVDVDNTDTKRLQDVKIDVFEDGLLEPFARCGQDFDFMTPKQFLTFACSYIAPHINQDRISTQLNAKATFTAAFSAVQLFEIISEQEHRTRQDAGIFRQEPTTYVHRDRNIELEITFSEPLPIVALPGKPYFVTFTIRNIGNGFVSALPPGRFSISQLNNVNIVQCEQFSTLSPIGKDFQTVSCRIAVPQELAQSSPPEKRMPGITHDSIAHQMTVNILYDYEIRKSAAVTIVR